MDKSRKANNFNPYGYSNNIDIVTSLLSSLTYEIIENILIIKYNLKSYG